jgi:Mg-chelatase subunit ChlD
VICAAALVLLMDASGSIMMDEWRVQLEATAAAIESPEVADAIRRGGPLAVQAIAFSNITASLTGWHVLTTPAEARGYAERVRQAPRAVGGGTDIGRALSAAHEAMRAAPCAPDRMVIDLSTDGEAPEAATAIARDAAQLAGVTINAIVVGAMARPESLREHAITGDGFLIEAADWSQYAALVRRKVILETAAR